MAKHKTCPFCGGAATECSHKNKSSTLYGVFCGNEDCPVQPSTALYPSKKGASKAWNKRADDGDSK